jgi:cell division protein FtsI (penicillin-binding protein 3)
MNSNSNKVVVIYIFFLFLLGIVLVRYGSVGLGKIENETNTVRKVREKSKRGSIVSADGYHLAYTTKSYTAEVNTKEIPVENRNLFARMFSLYSGEAEGDILRKISSRNGHVVLAKNLTFQQYQNIKELSREFTSLKILTRHKDRRGRSVFHGLSIYESGAKRNYPYGNSVTPVIGYTNKYEENRYTQVKGVKGIERRFEEYLKPGEDGYLLGSKDARGDVILNSNLRKRFPEDGSDIHLNINLELQRKIEIMLDKFKEKFEAKEIMSGVIESETGKVLSMATSNRFIRSRLKSEEIGYLQVKSAEYIFEPGSVVKPIVYALLLDKKMIRRGQYVNCENGRYKVGRKVITDEHKMKNVPAEEIIIHSSNIGMIKITENYAPVDFHNGLKQFGLGLSSGLEVSKENPGRLNTIQELKSKVYRATASFGHGFLTNFSQLLKAFNIFNNDGKIVSPKLVAYIKHPDGKIEAPEREYTIPENKQVLSVSTSRKMKNILVQTVKKGTGQGTDILGLEIGGKTGTAHIAKGSGYINEYHSSFFGFVNGKKRKYTIGVTVVEPQTVYFASQTAVPVFKEIIEILVDTGFLEKRYYKK